MVETRAQELAAAKREKATMIEESSESRFERMEAQNQKMEKQLSDVVEAINMLSASKQFHSPEIHQTPRFSSASASDFDAGRRSGNFSQFQSVTRLGKLDFPRFCGDGVQDWLFKVEQFFKVDQTPEDSKISTASIHLDGLAAQWHQNMLEDEVNVLDWPTYRSRVKERFEEIGEDPISELKKLQETDGIVDYHAKFEAIRTRVRLPESYLVSAYLAGLRIDTQMHIRMFEPQCVRQCLMLGKLYETAHPHKPSGNPWIGNKTAVKNPVPFKRTVEPHVTRTEKVQEQQLQPRRFLSTEEMNAKRAKGLCYFCDEKYTPEHYKTHKRAQLFILEVDDGGDEIFLDAEDGEDEPEGEVAHISAHAIEGISTYNTMRVKGTQNKKSFFMLVDSGSTHNFMDPHTAKRLGCSLLSSQNAKVRVADGYNLQVLAKIAKFEWEIHGTKFVADFMVIPLKGVDAVLGIQWLKPLGPITWDFTLLTMKFLWGKKKVKIHGVQPDSIRVVKADRLNKLREEDVQLSMLCVTQEEVTEEVTLATLTTEDSATPQSSQLSSLLEEYADVFAEPKGLPPFRKHHDHKIKLVEGSNPVNMRPYRYAIQQKDEIDKLVKDMLVEGLVQPSSSPFASSVVLVKKKDGSWRLCVDYRGLNNITIKDCFPIPLIEDLMDELGGAVIFSKLDLRAVYHQVRMAIEDIHKTAFKTHSGHYEYQVMPFGLTNSPATFQGLMNDTFRDFLRKFVLIFFDDILVYSASEEAHIHHLRSVLEVMRSQKLYAKRSKCAFATSRVEYLGHFIDKNGISTDPAKIQAVK